MTNLRSVELSEAFTPDGIAKLKQGQTLTFNYEGSLTTYKITKISRKDNRIWAREVRLYRPDEIQISDLKK